MSRILYKYCGAMRTSLLNDLLIRFTPLHELNDPYEGRFVLEPMEQERDAAIRDNFRAEWAQVEVYIHRTLGVLGALCLSRTPNNEVMWTHYASEHQGFVIGFNEHPNTFKGRAFIWSDYLTEIDLTSIDGFSSFRDVVYRDEPYVIPFGGQVPFDALFAKTCKWSYEEEVRIFRSIYDADKVIENGNGRIYLFKIPSPALAHVIVGANASEQVKAAAFAIGERPETAQVVIEQARIDHRARRIVFDPVHQ